MTELASKHILQPRRNILSGIGYNTERKMIRYSVPRVGHLHLDEEVISNRSARPTRQFDEPLDSDQSQGLAPDEKQSNARSESVDVPTNQKKASQFVETAKNHTSNFVELSSKEASEGFVKIEIVDTGIGITSEAQARLFQPFVQANAGISSRFGGTGLGLYITKIIIKQLLCLLASHYSEN